MLIKSYGTNIYRKNRKHVSRDCRGGKCVTESFKCLTKKMNLCSSVKLYLTNIKYSIDQHIR